MCEGGTLLGVCVCMAMMHGVLVSVCFCGLYCELMMLGVTMIGYVFLHSRALTGLRW